MNLFQKIDFYTDYNNSYSVRKALNTLGREFDLAAKNKNQRYAMEVINTVRKFYEKIRVMSHLQLLIPKTQGFVAYLIHRLKSEFGVADIKTEIIDTIAE